MKQEKKVSKSYTTTPTIFRRATSKAQKEGLTLSEKIDKLLKEDLKRRKVKPTDGVPVMMGDGSIDYI